MKISQAIEIMKMMKCSIVELGIGLCSAKALIVGHQSEKDWIQEKIEKEKKKRKVGKNEYLYPLPHTEEGKDYRCELLDFWCLELSQLDLQDAQAIERQ